MRLGWMAGLGHWRGLTITCLMAGGLAGGGEGEAGAPAAASVKSAKPPNVILVLSDALRRDHCSAYGYGRDTTPAMDELARRGVRFDHHLSPTSWTLPSIMTLFTGLSPLRHGLHDDTRPLPAGTPTLAGFLRERGYAAVGVTANPFSAAALGFGEGFDLYDDYTIALDFEMNLFDRGLARPDQKVWNTPTGRATTDLALRHVKALPAEQPYFLFALYLDPHTDYTPPAEYARRYAPDYAGEATGDLNMIPDTTVYENPRDLAQVKALYDAEIRYADEQIGRLLAELRAAGRLSDNDLIIYTSDHGEEFNEHGGIRHRRTLYGEGLRVPLVASWPARLPAGKTVDALTTHEDVFPALARELGRASAPGGLSPVDLFAAARGEAIREREGVGLHLLWADHDQDGWRTKSHSLLRDHGRKTVKAFDLAADPGEANPLPAADPVIPRLTARLENWRMSEEKRKLAAPPPSASGKPLLTPAQRAALKSMGYVR